MPTPTSDFDKASSTQANTHEQDAHTIKVTSELNSLVPSLRILIGLGITALIICGLYFGRDLLIPLALAVFFGFLLDPAVTKLKQWGLPRMVAVLTVITVALSLMIAGGTYLGMQLSGLSQQLPTYQDTIEKKLQNLKTYAEGPSVWDGAISTFSVIQRAVTNHERPENTSGATAKTQTSNPNDQVQEVKIVANEASASNQVLTWLGAIANPVATAGIVLLFVILILLDRSELRDRILRVLGGNLNVATDTLDEASERIGTYLRMQLTVNVTYGLPMAIGLWFIGVPAALLWGIVAVVMRFVPYVGPMISSVFPLALAFAVDPSWNMVLWTLGLILVLELISNNIIEPWLYGSSTGLSTLSVILAATFWTAIWGPVGLVLSTPLTACLLVLARYIPALKFIELLIGSAPVLDTPQRFYQRFLADDVEEAVELANEYIENDLPSKPEAAVLSRHVNAFYDEVALPALRLFSAYHNNVATAEHRLRMSSGLKQFAMQIQDDYPVENMVLKNDLNIHCIGARWDVDGKISTMLAHALQLNGLRANATAEPVLQNPDLLNHTSWDGVDVMCVSVFNPTPLAQIRLITRRLKSRYPNMHIVIGIWNADVKALAEPLKERFGITAVADGFQNLMLHLELLRPYETPQSTAAQAIPENEAQRLEALHQSDVFNPEHLPLYQDILAQLRNAFNTSFAQIAWVDHDWVFTPANPFKLDEHDPHFTGLPRVDSVCTYVVYQDDDLLINNMLCDPRFVENTQLQQHKIHFYAGVPLRDKKGFVLGSLSIMDTESREMEDEDWEVLNDMANQLMAHFKSNNKRTPRLVNETDYKEGLHPHQ